MGLFRYYGHRETDPTWQEFGHKNGRSVKMWFWTHDFKEKKTGWFYDYIVNKIESISAIETQLGKHVTFGFTIFLIMLNQSDQSDAELKLAESLFLNLCSAATMSTYNTIQMLSLFDHLISEKPEDYTKLLYSKLEEHLTNSHSEKNFDEIKSLPCQEISSLLWTENRNPNTIAIDHLKE